MSPATEKRFWLLRRLSKVMSVLAWIVLVIVLLVVPVGFARAIMPYYADRVFHVSVEPLGLFVIRLFLGVVSFAAVAEAAKEVAVGVVRTEADRFLKGDTSFVANEVPKQAGKTAVSAGVRIRLQKDAFRSY